jgi:hypothetical protein
MQGSAANAAGLISRDPAALAAYAGETAIDCNSTPADRHESINVPEVIRERKLILYSKSAGDNAA